MKSLAIIANCDKPRAQNVLTRLQAKANDLGLTLYADEATAECLPGARAVSVNEIFDLVDGVVAMGGDGTLLRVARSLNGRSNLILGVNIGSLGFLTSVREDQMETGLECLAGDRYIESRRSVARVGVETPQEDDGGVYRALNDVVLSRGPSSRVVNLEVFIDSDLGTSYVCDGLIVSTPTGSTGHSLSAGGPILSPDTQAFVISLICPHTLSSRPLVMPDGSDIVIKVADSAAELLLSVDGQVDRKLTQGDRIRVTRSEKDVRFAHLPDYNYYAVLREKLHWSGRSL